MRLTLHSILPAAALAATMALVAGCASKAADAPIDWDHGARRGRVVARFTPDSAGAALPPCLASLPADAFSAQRYVKVRYRQGRHMQDTVAELPPGQPMIEGEQVELWPANCAAGQLAHISRVLPAPVAGGD
jgi:hypothetical protein